MSDKLVQIEKRLKELVPEILNISSGREISVTVIIKNEETRNKVYEAQLEIQKEFHTDEEPIIFHVGYYKEVQ